jgi:signal peptidase II
LQGRDPTRETAWGGDEEGDRGSLVDDGRVTDESTDSVEATKTDDSAGPQPRRRLWLLVSVAVTVLVLDVVTKALAVKLLTPNQPVSIIGDTVTWTLVRNPGAAFSLAAGYTLVLTVIATGVVVGIVWMAPRLVSPWWALGLGMILGGALGNLMDRFFRGPAPLQGHVIDFVSIGWWPVFNVADPAVVGGAALLVGLSFFGYDFDTVGRRKAGDGPAEPEHGDPDESPAERAPDHSSVDVSNPKASESESENKPE